MLLTNLFTFSVPECSPFKSPKNGAARCIDYGVALGCTVACRDTYDFVYKPAISYSCSKGTWNTYALPGDDYDPRLPWPDCSSKSNSVFMTSDALWLMNAD